MIVIDGNAAECERSLRRQHGAQLWSRIEQVQGCGCSAVQHHTFELFGWYRIVAGSAALIWLTLGFRESGIVAIAIPVTLALTLTVCHLYGYTLNRITLFALIFSIGILVDDAIVVVENIARQYHLPGNRGRPIVEIAVAS